MNEVEAFMRMAKNRLTKRNRRRGWTHRLLPVLLTSTWLVQVQGQSFQSQSQSQSHSHSHSKERPPSFLPIGQHLQQQAWDMDDDDSSWRMPASLAEAIDQALLRRLDVRLSRTDLTEARARTRQAQSRFHPRLDVALEFRNTRQWDDYSDVTASYDLPGTGPVNIELSSEASRYQLLPRIEATYNLYSGGGDEAGVRHARILTHAAELGLQMVSQQVILDVVRRYLDLRKHCVGWEIAHADMRMALLKVDIMKRRYGRGRLSDIEFQEAEFERLESEQTLFNRARQVKGAYGRYAMAITDQPGSVKEPASVCHFDRSSKDEIDRLEGLRTDNPGLKKAVLDEEAAREQLTLEKASKKPQVALFAQYNLVSRRDDRIRRLVGDTSRQDAVLGVRVSYNLYDGQLADARQQGDRAVLQRQQIRREQQAARLNDFRYRQLLRHEELNHAVEMARVKLRLASSRRLLAEKRFKSGKISTMQQMESRTSEDKARLELDIAEIDRIRAHVDSMYAEAALSAEGDAFYP